MEKQYEVYIECDNCGVKAKLKIKKGELVEMTECPNCGCTWLRRQGTSEHTNY